jgi:hypothetical protein
MSSSFLLRMYDLPFLTLSCTLLIVPLSSEPPSTPLTYMCSGRSRGTLTDGSCGCSPLRPTHVRQSTRSSTRSTTPSVRSRHRTANGATSEFRASSSTVKKKFFFRLSEGIMKPTLPHVQVSITPEPAFKQPFGAASEAGLRLRSRPFTLPSSSQGLSTLPQSGNPDLCLSLKWTHRFISTISMCPPVPLLPPGPLSRNLLSCIPSKIMQPSPPQLAR